MSLLESPRAGFRLSPQQRRLWLAGGSAAAFRSECSALCRGPVDRQRLEAALRAVATRHEILRTRLRTPRGMTLPVQVVEEELPRLGHLAADRDGGSRGAGRDGAGLELELSSEGTDGGAGTRLRLRAPALLLDGRSLRHLLAELLDAYDGAAIPEAPVQYADLAAWLNELQGRPESTGSGGEEGPGEGEQPEGEVWRLALRDAVVSALPFEGSAGAVEGFSPRRSVRDLPAAVTARLEGLAATLGTGVEAVVGAAWWTFLGRLHGTEGSRPVVVEHAFDGRSYEELEDALGLFEQFLPVPLPWRPADPFREVVQRLADLLGELYEVQEFFPGSGDDAGAGDPPPPRHAFAFRDSPPALRAAGLELLLVEEQSVTAPFTLRLTAWRREDARLRLELDHDPEALSETAARRLLDGLLAFLSAAVEAPDTRLGELPLLAPADRRELLHGLNDGALLAASDGLTPPTAAATDRPFHALFEAQAKRTPGRPAVGWGEHWLSYGELDARAGILARRLRAAGVGPEQCVALCLARSPEYVVALLAVLKAGGAYLPLDPDQPASRLAAMVEAARPRLALTDAVSEGALPAELPRQRLDPAAAASEGSIPAVAGGIGDREEPAVPTAALAYVLFTSGSTGTPKGVAVEHRQLVHYVRSAAARLGLSGDERFALVSTFAADLGHTALFAALASGGSVAVVPWQETLSAQSLAAAQPYDGLKIVPSHLEALLAQEGGGDVLPRRRLVLGGEACRWDLVRRCRERVPGLQVFNHYGPTEVTVGALAGQAGSSPASGGPATVPLGRPLAGNRAYLLDRALQPLPPGVPGELFLGGKGVARGYVGRPAATAARFLPDPHAAEAGGRMYRTGDRVRQLEDGSFEFLGRTDHQVKVRGFRVELGEVESHLRRLPGVEEAVVQPFTGTGGELRLAAYFVALRQHPPSAADLRSALSRSLPEPMVPSSFTRLDALPLNANGKVDRAALPEPEMEGGVGDRRLPSGAVEEGLALIWSDLLGRDAIGAEDDFFDLGGHSLLVTRLVARVEGAFGVTLPLDVPFENPRLADQAAAVEAALRDRVGVAFPPIEPRPAGTPGELSLAQQRLWLLDRLDPGSAAFNVPAAVRLRGGLVAGALAASIARVSERHEVLRSRFPEQGGRPTLVLDPPLPPRLPLVDLSGLADERRRTEAARLLREEGSRPLDLAAGPVLRVTLLRHGAADHVLLYTMHHVVCDAWSRLLWVREVAALYAAAVRGEAAALPDLPVQYADFAAWQRRWLQGENLARLMEYWRRRLEGLPVLELPTDRPRPRAQSYRGGRVRFVVPTAVTAQVTTASRSAETTPFVTLAAAFQALLHRYSGHDSFGVGTPALHRGRPETENLVGFFLNLLVLRAEIDPAGSFRSLQEAVRRDVLQALVHQDLPFEKLVEELAPERSMGRSPLFQVFFTLQNVPRDAVALPSLALETLSVPVTTAKYDLSLFLEPRGGELGAVLEYAADLFDEVTVRRLGGHFLRLLESAVGEPDRPLAALPLLSAAERHQVVREWNDTAGAVAEVTLHRLVAERARRSPGALAVRFAGGSLTYGELQERAERVAGHLAALGVRRGDRVAVYVERGPALLVATLGTLAAGAAYVPMDPLYPPPRLALMAEDSAVTAAVSEEALVGDLALPAERTVLLRGGDVEPPLPGGPAPAAVGGDDLAYVIYTSGSTGRPKGVEVTHAALFNFLRALRGVLGAAAAQRMLALTTLSFDIATLELFLPLVCGGRVVIASREEARDVQMLPALLAAEGVTTMQATPTTWRLLLDAGWSGDPRLTAVCGGEALPADLAARLRCRVGRLWNVYGPTEATVWATVERVEEDGAPAIGRPLTNVRAQVLGGDLEPVPVGVPGQLWLGGEALARGYHRDPARTAERFRPDGGDPAPVADGVGRRLYATGDLARWRHDGRLEYLGRADQQVKLRGYRIEPGEVEARLGQHPAVRAAAVALRDDGRGPRLVAWFVAVAEAPEVSELRSHLGRSLPGYMVPSVFVELPELPRTPNGKIDRRALPTPDGGTRSEAGTLPATPFERRLAELWRDLLGIDAVFLESSFFELGGHSLLATRLLFRAREELGVEAPLRLLFESPTLGAMAAALEARRRGDGVVGEQDGLSSLPAIVPDPAQRHEAFPLNPVQHAYWIGRQGAFDLGNVASHSYRELSLPGLDPGRLEAALRKLIARHDMLRAVVLPDGRQQVLEQVPPLRLPVLDLRGLAPPFAERAFQAVREEMSHQMIATDRWPLFDLRVTLRGDEVFLHVSFDYLIADGWSIPVLMRDIARLYADPRTSLPPLELSFRDCVLAELDLRRSAAYERSRRYWTQRLETLPPAPELPRVRELGSLDSPRFVRRSGQLDAVAWGRLKKRAGALGLTPSALLLAAFAEVVAAWSKEPRFTLNVTLFNRLPLHPQILEVVGDFTSLNLLEVDLSARRSFAAGARAVQGRLWEDLEHRLFSGVEVIRELVRRRGRASGALMPVVFTSFLVEGRQAARPPAARDDEPERPRGGLVYNITQTPQVWLDHQVTERAGVLRFNWDAVDDLFPPGLLDELFATYRRLLQRLADSDEAWEEVWEGDLPASQRTVRLAVNDTTAPRPEHRLHEPFLRRAEEAPDRTAVIDPRRTLSRGELRQRSAEVADLLRRHGARADRPVAVVMAKGWEQVVAVLGIAEAGAPYLPVDAGLPTARRQQLLARGGVDLVLTQSSLEERLEWPAGMLRMSVGPSGTRVVGEEPLPRPADSTEAGPDDLAYVLFTSGSTGEPKGVAVEHRAAANTVMDVNRRFAIREEDRVLALSSLSFDLSVWDVFGVLAAGGALVLPEPEASRDPARWLDLVRRHRVTVWNSVPALLEMFVEHAEGAGGDTAALRLALLSGDWIPLHLPDRFRRLAPVAQVVSLGGATEAAIWSILHPVEEVDPTWSSIPYGRPMANQRFRVLDARLRDRPDWSTGHLYIAGDGLARGYWDDPETTAASFFAHPRDGERLYRTGDLGRYLPDGTIEFLGRDDQQVKIRGHRIELGEVEAVLDRCPDLTACAVTAVGDRHDRRLVAYGVPAAGAPAGEELARAVRVFLGQRLPAYMVPADFVTLERLPLTANGKVDRRALPEPGRATATDGGGAPATALQRQIAATWREVLGIEKVGLRDNFFDLGGDSVRMVQVHNRLQTALGRELSIVDLFANPTLEALSTALAPPSAGEAGGASVAGETAADAADRARTRRASRRQRRRRRETPAGSDSAEGDDGTREADGGDS